jgi:transketolase
VAYAGNSVRIFGSDAGVTAAFNGGTHMPFEDMALYRAAPGSTVIEISDAAMLKAVMRLIKERAGLTYVRTTRKSYPALYSEDHPFEIGKGEIVRNGADVTVIAVGLMVGEALKAAETLEMDGVSVRVVDMFTVKPLDTALLKRCAQETESIVTAENHNTIGGLGDAVLSGLQELGILKTVKKIGVDDRFGAVGPQEYLPEVYGLTSANITACIRGLKTTGFDLCKA